MSSDKTSGGPRGSGSPPTTRRKDSTSTVAVGSSTTSRRRVGGSSEGQEEVGGKDAPRPSSPPPIRRAPTSSFDPTYTAAVFEACGQHTAAIPATLFLDGCREIKLLVGKDRVRGGTPAPLTLTRPPPPPPSSLPTETLGPAMSIASADIAEKIGVIEQR